MPNSRLLALVAGFGCLAPLAPATAQSVTEFALPNANSAPFGITGASDGALWFTELNTGLIGRIDTTGAVTEFGGPAADAEPFSITPGADGSLWFTENNGQLIGNITISGVVTESAPIGGSPGGIAVGADGAIWSTQTSGGSIVRSAADGSVDSFLVTTPDSAVHQMAAGPDGALWFSETGESRIGRVALDGTIREFPLPHAVSEPFGIVTGEDGALWFTEDSGNRIGRITTAGTLTEFSLPQAGSQPLGITAAADGALWFSEAAGNRIGRITTTGAITEFAIPTPNSMAQGVAAGIDGNVWFVEQKTGKIGRVSVPASASPLVASALPSSRSIVIGATATAFATIINSGAKTAHGCAVAPVTAIPASFSYQATDPATNAVIGSPNTPVSIGPGAAQSFVVAFTATAAFAPTDTVLGFACADADAAPSGSGLNTLLLSASASSVPDIVALVATPSGDGILDLAGIGGANAFALASVDLGVSGTLTVSLDTGAARLPIALSLCPTDASTGTCLSAPTNDLSMAIKSGTTPTFSVFATAQGAIPFAPAKSRIFIRFADSSGAIRGSTSVAVRTQ